MPVAVGLYSTAFNIFNTLLLFPIIGVFDRVLSRIGHDAAEDVEDYSTPRYLSPGRQGDLASAVPAVQQELGRYLEGAAALLELGRGHARTPGDPKKHQAAIDVLSRDIRAYAGSLLRPGMPYAEADLVASLIEEADLDSSLGETLHQIVRRVERETFSPAGRELVDTILAEVADAMRVVTASPGESLNLRADAAARLPAVAALRERCLTAGPELPSADRGAVLALLGSAERAFVLVERIVAERRSVPRTVIPAEPAASRDTRPGDFGAAPVPAE